jgi:hypothetical protein
MVSRDKKKKPSLHEEEKAKVVEAYFQDHLNIKNMKNCKSDSTQNPGSKSGNKTSVVSAIVFDKKKDNISSTNGSPKKQSLKRPVTASIFTEDVYDLSFANKMRNVIEYTFECLRDSVSEQTPKSSYLKRSIEEMKSLSLLADKRLSPETERRLNELIEETEAFVKGEKTALTNTDDFEGVQHYRHYVRIAWLTHFILGDLSDPDLQ